MVSTIKTIIANLELNGFTFPEPLKGSELGDIVSIVTKIMIRQKAETDSGNGYCLAELGQKTAVVTQSLALEQIIALVLCNRLGVGDINANFYRDFIKVPIIPTRKDIKIVSVCKDNNQYYVPNFHTFTGAGRDAREAFEYVLNDLRDKYPHLQKMPSYKNMKGINASKFKINKMDSTDMTVFVEIQIFEPITF